MTVVTNKVVDPTGAPVPGARVTIRLWLGANQGLVPTPGYDSISDQSIVSIYSGSTDAAGVWSANLIPNVNIVPAGSAYEVIEEPGISSVRKSYIQVPNVGGPFFLGDILQDPPSAISVDENLIYVQPTPPGAPVVGTTWIDTSSLPGVATLPAFSGVRAYKSGAVQSIPDNTHTAVSLDVELYDTDSYHSIVTNTTWLVVPVTGKYRVVGQVAFAFNANKHRSCAIWKTSVPGGTRLAQTTMPSNTDAAGPAQRFQAVTGPVDLVAGDIILLGAWQNSGAALNCNTGLGETFISLEKVIAA